MTPIQYPQTRRDDVVDTLFGEKIADPYRWLENDVRNDPEVADWVTPRKPCHPCLSRRAATARLVSGAYPPAYEL
jgi:hypothetical protein